MIFIEEAERIVSKMICVSDLQYDPVEKAYHIDYMFHGYCVWKTENEDGYYIKLSSENEVITNIPSKKEFGLYSWEWFRSDLLKVMELINYLEDTYFEIVLTRVNFVDMN